MLHGERSQGFGEVQTGPLCLRKGEVTSYSSDVENELLHVHVPGLLPKVFFSPQRAY